ncbi:MAG: T9SS type A sorting domain-containing protein [Flavobacteriia bacterium]|nr:T9SS type A sorting domain-containing protein [Flavobacteriia bacterium]
MKKNVFFLSVSLILFLNVSKAQVAKSDIIYWSGSGPDSAVFVVDFNDQSTNPSHAWGFLFDENNSVSIQNMIESFIANGMEVTADMNGGFLNNFSFLNHDGIGGTNSYYWATYSGESFQDLTLNLGISEMLTNNKWLAFSFTDWQAVEPYNPIQSIDLPIMFQSTASLNNAKQNSFSVVQNENDWMITGEAQKIELFNQMGQKIAFWENSSELLINHSVFPKGMYFLQIESESQQTTIKLLK